MHRLGITPEPVPQESPHQRATPRCPVCDKKYDRNLAGRSRKFCSNRCRMRARYSGAPAFGTEISKSKNKSLYGLLSQNTERNDSKNPCAARVGQRGIFGPRHVIAAEVTDARDWHEEVSSDGVRSYVTRIHPPTLVERQAPLPSTPDEAT